jgi:hypothetical protein
MPVVVEAIAYLYDAYEGVVAAGGLYGAIAEIVVDVAVSIAVSKITQALAGKLSPTQNATPASRMITARGTMEYQQLIYGQIRTAGFLAYYGTSGVESRFLLDYIAAE